MRIFTYKHFTKGARVEEVSHSTGWLVGGQKGEEVRVCGCMILFSFQVSCAWEIISSHDSFHVPRNLFLVLTLVMSSYQGGVKVVIPIGTDILQEISGLYQELKGQKGRVMRYF